MIPHIPQRRGVIFAMVLGITMVLVTLALVFGSAMRTESLASANRLAAAQADAIELGAEKWVVAEIESNAPDSGTILGADGEALQIGDGYFWVIRPDTETTDQLNYGIADESGKLNINTANAEQLIQLPGMTSDIADAIIDWRDEDSNPSPYGAENEYYGMLPQSYSAKNSAFESMEELLLVKNITPELLYGYDRNRNGIVDLSERNSEGTSSLFNSAGTDALGFANYVTVYSVEQNNSSSGNQRVNVNTADVTPLRNILRNAFAQTRADQIEQRVQLAKIGAGPNPFPNLGIFYTASQMTVAEFTQIVDQITTSNQRTLRGRLNINTAARPAMLALPGLTSADVDALISKRSGADTTSIAWIFDALTAEKAAGIANSITARSYQYSADIVAISGDGRAFRRVKIVVDAQSTPAKILYRKDLTDQGWPLDESIRESLRAGRGLTGRTNGLMSQGRRQKEVGRMNGIASSNQKGIHL